MDDPARADHAALALQNAHLVAELKARQARLETLVEVNRDLSRIRPLAALLSVLARACAQLLDADFARFRVARDRELVPVATWGDPQGVVPTQAIRVGDGFVGRVAQTGAALAILDLTRDERIAPAYREGVARYGAGSGLGVPVKVGDQVVGVLSLARRGPQRFSGDDIAVAAAFASQAAVAVENARLWDQAEERRREAEELARLAWTVTEHLDVTTVTQQIVESAVVLLRGHASVLRVRQADGSLLAIASAGLERDSLAPGHVVAAGTGVTGRAVREGRPVSSSDLLRDPAVAFDEPLRRRNEAARTRAVLAVPVRLRDEVLGALAVTDDTARVFSGAEIRLLQAFGDQAALALERARLHAETERQRREAETLAELMRTINASLDLDTVLRRVGRAARNLCRADLAWVALPPTGSDAMVMRCWPGARRDWRDIRVEPGDGIGGQVLVTGRPFRTEGYTEDSRISKPRPDVILAEGVVAAMVVPIASDGRIHGLLYVANHAPRPFTDRDEAVLLRLADHAAVAIRNAELFDGERKARVAAEASHEALRRLSARLVEVQEAASRELARELHDEIGQALTGLKFSLEAIARAAPGTVSSRLGDAEALVNELIARVRELSLDLRPAVLDDLGLLPALRWYIERYTARTGIEVTLERAGVEGRFSAALETAAYRIAQEALTNVARHPGVRRATVRLQANGGTLSVEVEDLGIGFDPQAVEVGGASSGLSGMRERAKLLGGSLRVDTAPGAGARVTAELPLGRDEEQGGSATAVP
jgi:signal transduction histidine kinase